MHEPIDPGLEDLARHVVESAIVVHRELGPGLLERTYLLCLAQELASRGHSVRLEVPQPVVYQGMKLDSGFRIDLLIDERLVVEVKAIETLHPVHTAQVLTYLKFSGHRLGLLLNFNVLLMKDGIKRVIR